MRLWVRSLPLLSGLTIRRCRELCGVGCGRGSDPALLWLWRRPVATAPIQPLAWEPPYAAGAAQEIATTTTKDKKKKQKNQKTHHQNRSSQSLFFFSSFVFFVVVAISWAAPAAHGGSQARGQIGAVATGLHHSHSHAGPEPRLRPTP